MTSQGGRTRRDNHQSANNCRDAIDRLSPPRRVMVCMRNLLRVTASGDDADKVRSDIRHVVKDLPGQGVSFICSTINRVSSALIVVTPKETSHHGENGGSAVVDCRACRHPRYNASQVVTGWFTSYLRPGVVGGHPRGSPCRLSLSSRSPNVHSALFALELAANYQRFWARGSVAVANQWKLNSLAAIVELVSKIRTACIGRRRCQRSGQ